jgi:hypothetical protein
MYPGLGQYAALPFTDKFFTLTTQCFRFAYYLRNGLIVLVMRLIDRFFEPRAMAFWVQFCVTKSQRLTVMQFFKVRTILTIV